MQTRRLLVSCAVLGAAVACGSSEDGAGGGGSGSSYTADGGAYGSGGSPLGGGGSSGRHGSGGSAGSGYGGSGSFVGGGGSGGRAGSSGSTFADAGSEGPEGGGDAGAEDADADACAGLDASQGVSFFLSADDSNSMASPAIARRRFNSNLVMPPGLVRTHEFLNYYDIGFAPAAPGKLAIAAELGAADEQGGLELGIAVVAPAAKHPRRPIVLTFVLDTSGSMAGDPIQLERAAVLAIASELSAGDIVSAVTWHTQNGVILDSYLVKGPNDPKLVSMAYALTVGGGTDLNSGLQAGYALAQMNFESSRLNRVVLISDGQANVGVTDENVIANGAKLNDGEGVYLVGVGVGDGVNDTLMNAVTDAGRGAYVYLDSTNEAKTMFGARFDEVMDVAARGVQVELRLPWYMGIQKFFGEEYSTNSEEIEPQHLAPDDAMVFDQLLAPCASTHYSAADPIEIIARWKLPVTHEEQEVAYTSTFAELSEKTPSFLPKAAAIIAYAEALKKPMNEVAAALVEARALAVSADPAGTDPELAEIRQLIDQAILLY